MHMPGSHRFSLIIPVYNGAQYLRATFEELHTAYGDRDVEIIFVNDGSVDETESLLYALREQYLPVLPRLHIVTYPINKGKGYAVQEGVKKAAQDSSFIAFTDVELPYGLKKMDEAMDILISEAGIGMVIGDRTQADSGKKQYAWKRNMMRAVFRLTVPPQIRFIHDTQSGVKVFRRDILPLLFSRVRTTRWVFDLELFLIAVRHGIGIYQLPVTIKPSCLTRGGVSIVAHTRQIARDIIRIYWYDLRGTYKKDNTA